MGKRQYLKCLMAEFFQKKGCNCHILEAQEIQRNPYLGTGTDRIVKCRTKTKVLKQKPEDSGIITVLNENKGQFKTVCFVKQSNIRAK